MAIDSLLEVTGKDTYIHLTDDITGFLEAISITKFQAKPDITAIQVKPIGQSGANNGQEIDGWSGSFDVNFSSPSIEDLIQDIQDKNVLSIAKRIDLHETTIFRNGQMKSYLYPNVKLTFDKNGERGSAQTIAVTWISGDMREETL